MVKINMAVENDDHVEKNHGRETIITTEREHHTKNQCRERDYRGKKKKKKRVERFLMMGRDQE
jgi:hypothetical protein